ncbi:hypothetical protein ERO13_D06G139401v2, partial [Gossypium hirsutum]
LNNYAQGVVIREQGPVFVTAFSPLCMIITAALGSFILAEKVHLGSIIGTVIIIFGLYTVLWGKSKDQKNSTATKNDKVQELLITDGSKSTKLEDSMWLVYVGWHDCVLSTVQMHWTRGKLCR